MLDKALQFAMIVSVVADVGFRAYSAWHDKREAANGRDRPDYDNDPNQRWPDPDELWQLYADARALALGTAMRRDIKIRRGPCGSIFDRAYHAALTLGQEDGEKRSRGKKASLLTAAQVDDRCRTLLGYPKA